MGLPLALLVALLAFLPGVLCLATFYAESGTDEVRITPPPLRSTVALAFIGFTALLAHAIWLAALAINAALPPLLPIPPADPYRLLASTAGAGGLAQLIALFGALCVCMVGMQLGSAMARMGWGADRRADFLYGWLAPIVKRAEPDNAFINGYALTTNQREADLLGYEGTVTNLILDQDKQIIGATLEDVETFYIRMNKNGTRRVKGGTEISTLILRKDDFQNIALEVIVDEGLAISPAAPASANGPEE